MAEPTRTLTTSTPRPGEEQTLARSDGRRLLREIEGSGVARTDKTEEFDFRPRPPSLGAINDMAKELDAVSYRHPDGEVEEEVERSLLKYSVTMRDNRELREKVAEMASERADMERAHHATEMILKDKIAFLEAKLSEIQQQRDVFANYSIEVKTRCQNLATVLANNGSSIDGMISSTVSGIERHVASELDKLRLTMANNSATASALIGETLDAAKNDAIVDIQRQRARERKSV